jgi:pimeloyl-CoA synthetase
MACHRWRERIVRTSRMELLDILKSTIVHGSEDLVLLLAIASCQNSFVFIENRLEKEDDDQEDSGYI